MNNTKKNRGIAPAKKEKATDENEDWKEICENCEILRLYHGCTYGCELVKASLNKRKKKEEGNS